VNHSAGLDGCGKVPREEYFTEMGIYTALMKSNKPVAK
jgi:prophage antirepressor-like protein